jgi:hypothetical protein
MHAGQHATAVFSLRAKSYLVLKSQQAKHAKQAKQVKQAKLNV